MYLKKRVDVIGQDRIEEALDWLGELMLEIPAK